VREGARHRRLEKHRDPLTLPEEHRYPLTLPEEFEWGYEGAGPGVLAEAILADRLGYNSNLAVTTAFEREVVARLETTHSSGSEVRLSPVA
jgi:hypothetical protein